MKLRHLFENLALAEMLVKNWDYDEDSLDLFQDFRISANAIYPFKQNGELCFLRCCPTSEKQLENLVAELEFINYLRANGYQALEPLPSKSAATVVQKSTPWGDHYASAFKRVEGVQISRTGLDDKVIFAYGAALGQLHALSSAYTAPKTRRWTHLEVFDWIEMTLDELPANPLPVDELKLLRDYFAGLPIQPGNYGLIHYDFETDNVFYDEATSSCNVIDFDDAMYHWFIMDIVQSIDSLASEIPGNELAQKQALFLDGYRSRFDINDDELLATQSIYQRFANLYGYTRGKRCIQERWENEPDWMVSLREKLNRALTEDARFFGKSLDVTH